jgi:DNA-binding PadR family transcriptional regulator
MSVTRLLILGAVRIFQPTHGYFVRRELGTWQVAEWAHLNPGSIYNALRALSKEGMLIEEPAEDGAPRSRTTYRLTVDGEQEFLRLVREGLWELHPYEPGWLLAGMAFWGALTREEVLAALDARTSLLKARISGTGFALKGMPETAAGTPDHVSEMFHIHLHQLTAEVDWIADATARIRRGDYGFSGEDPSRLLPRSHPMRAPGQSLR